MFKSLKNRIDNVQVSGEGIYLFSFGLCLFLTFIMNTTFLPYLMTKYFNLNWIQYLAMGLLIIKIIFYDDYKIYQLLIMGCIVGIALISWRRTHYIMLLVMIIFILSAKNVDFSKIIKCYLKINGVMLSMCCIYALLGIIVNLKYVRDGVTRLSLGIDYPTDLAAYIFYYILALMFIRYSKINSKDYFLLILASFCTYLITNARLDSVLILMIVPIFALAKRADRNKVISVWFCNGYLGLILILPYLYYLLTYYYNGDAIYQKINNMLSGRLYYGNVAINRYGLSLLGQHVVEKGWGGLKGRQLFNNDPQSYFFIDSSFLKLFIVYGVLLGILVIGIMMFISWRGITSHKYLFPAIILMVTISSMIDHHLMEITFNPFLLSLLAKNTLVNKGDRINE